MNIKIVLPLFILAFIIGIIILSIVTSRENEKFKDDFKNKLPLYCAFLKELEFEGEIILIKKTFSSGQPDLIEVKCSFLNYPDNALNNEYFEKIEDDDLLRIKIPRTYTRLSEDKLVKGDRLKSDKDDFRIYRVTQSKEKIEIDILENKYDYKCQ